MLQEELLQEDLNNARVLIYHEQRHEHATVDGFCACAAEGRMAGCRI